MATFEREVLAWNAGGRVSPRASPLTTPGSLSGAVSVDLGLRGPHYTLYATCASAAHAIGLAVQQIREGRIDRAIAGGAEASLTPFGVAMFEATGIVASDRCRPFDRGRDGTTLGDGAAFVVLEAAEVAAARGASPLAEIAGYAATGDAFSWTATPEDGRGLVAAMRGALDDAAVAPRDVGVVSAHATATRRWDASEAHALREVFGEHLDDVALHATKGATSHLIGATGALEVILTARALRDGLAPPTAGLEELDAELGVRPVVGEAQTISADVALSNAAGFGGSNACLVLRRV